MVEVFQVVIPDGNNMDGSSGGGGGGGSGYEWTLQASVGCWWRIHGGVQHLQEDLSGVEEQGNGALDPPGAPTDICSIIGHMDGRSTITGIGGPKILVRPTW